MSAVVNFFTRPANRRLPEPPVDPVEDWINYLRRTGRIDNQGRRVR